MARSLEVQPDDGYLVLNTQDEALENAEAVEAILILLQDLRRGLHPDDEVDGIAPDRNQHPGLWWQCARAEHAERNQLPDLVGRDGRHIGNRRETVGINIAVQSQRIWTVVALSLQTSIGFRHGSKTVFPVFVLADRRHRHGVGGRAEKARAAGSTATAHPLEERILERRVAEKNHQV